MNKLYLLDILFSTLLFIGISSFGFYILRATPLYNPNFSKFKIYISPIFGSAILILLLFPYLLFNTNTLISIKFISYFLIGMGLINLYTIISNIKKIKNDLMQIDFNELSYLVLILFFILSILPITSADALDYHLGVPKYILENGMWPNTPNWFSSRLAGGGEVITTIGLSIGASLITSMIQFYSIYIIFIILSKNKYKHLFSSIFLTIPALLFLVTSSKPQIYGTCLIVTCIFLIYSTTLNGCDKSKFLWNIILASFFLLVSLTIKLNFAISVFSISLIIFYLSYKKQEFFKISLFFIIILIATNAPYLYWKFTIYNPDIISLFLNPFPGDQPGYKNFYFNLKHYKESLISFPLSIILPGSLGAVTTTLGPAIIIPFLLFLANYNKISKKLNYDLNLFLYCSIGIFILSTMLGQMSSRFFLEAVLIFIFYIANNDINLKFYNYKFIKYIVNANIILLILVSFFYIINIITPAIINRNIEYIYLKFANGYSEFKWVKNNLPKGATLASSVRSIYFAPDNFYSLEWSSYINPTDPEAIFYLNLMKEARVTYLLTHDPISDPFRGCFDSKNTINQNFNSSYRNPYNQRHNYKSYLVKFNYNNLPACILNIKQ